MRRSGDERRTVKGVSGRGDVDVGVSLRGVWGCGAGERGAGERSVSKRIRHGTDTMNKRIPPGRSRRRGSAYERAVGACCVAWAGGASGATWQGGARDRVAFGAGGVRGRVANRGRRGRVPFGIGWLIGGDVGAYRSGSGGDQVTCHQVPPGLWASWLGPHGLGCSPSGLQALDLMAWASGLLGSRLSTSWLGLTTSSLSAGRQTRGATKMARSFRLQATTRQPRPR